MKAQVSVGLINPGRRVCLRGKQWSGDGCHISLDLGQSFSNQQGHASPGRTTIFRECTGLDHPRSKKRGMKAAAQEEAKTRFISSRRDAPHGTFLLRVPPSAAEREQVIARSAGGSKNLVDGWHCSGETQRRRPRS